ncbi:LysR substrate-binding domain-containing protein [Nocardia terpenica]|uniref:LysR substrate-binding domain-containing protein n=1 Tax=Nocardia terpenica TaxID=455432 RepID=UPI00142D7BE6|nr:LysR substrate-binding domain-containing protein [Nocardia terpenica]
MPGSRIAVHVGVPADSVLRLRRLAPNRRIVCAAPEYLARVGRPATVVDLVSHNCPVLRENEGDYARWRFGKDGREQRIRVFGTLSSNDGETVTRWALQGFGLVMRSRWCIEKYLRSGELVQVPPEVVVPAADIVAVFGDSRALPRRVLEFVDYPARELPGSIERGRC